jgi:hypothetical protein
MNVDDGNILAWGLSYRLLRTRLVSRYADCLAGLTIEGDKTDAIFYSLPEPDQTPTQHNHRPRR